LNVHPATCSLVRFPSSNQDQKVRYLYQKEGVYIKILSSFGIYIYMFIYTFTNQKLKDSSLTQKSPGRVLHVTFLTGPKQGGEDTHPSIETDFVGKVLT